MTPGSRAPGWNPPKVATAPVRERIMLEYRDVILKGQAAFEAGDKQDFWWWQNYAAALVGLMTDEWALMTLALWEAENGEG